MNTSAKQYSHHLLQINAWNNLCHSSINEWYQPGMFDSWHIGVTRVMLNWAIIIFLLEYDTFCQENTFENVFCIAVSILLC